MLDLNAERKIVNTTELQLYQNTFIYNDSIIQLDNISQISVAPVEQKPIPTWALAFIVLGVFGLFSSFRSLAIIAILIGGVCAACISYSNSQLGHYLTLELNSGRKIYFSGKNEEFLKKIMRLIGDYMNNKNKTIGYTFHMEHAEIQQMQIGDYNKMINKQ